MLALGIRSLRVGLLRTHAAGKLLLARIPPLGINYIPDAVVRHRHRATWKRCGRTGDEISDKGAAMRKYRRRSL